MDSEGQYQVGVVLKHPPIGSLYPWERAGVRAGDQKDTTAG